MGHDLYSIFFGTKDNHLSFVFVKVEEILTHPVINSLKGLAQRLNWGHVFRREIYVELCVVSIAVIGYLVFL